MPELSLIIATLGRTLELDRLMMTLTNQSFKNFEIIIVDDAYAYWRIGCLGRRPPMQRV
jgi:hypothetical protein